MKSKSFGQWGFSDGLLIPSIAGSAALLIKRDHCGEKR